MSSPTNYGIDPVTGFNAKPSSQIQADYDAFMKSGPLGQSAGTNPDGSIPVTTIAGQIKTFAANVFSGLWQLLQGIYSSWDPAQAVGASQDAVNSITGSLRNPEAFSSVTETLTGIPGTAVQAGSVVNVGTSGSSFASAVEATIGSALSAWAAAIYAVAARVATSAGVWQVAATNGSAAISSPVLSAPAYSQTSTYGTVGVAVKDPATGNLWYVKTAYSGGAGGAISFPSTGTPGTTTQAGASTLVFTLAQLFGTTSYSDANTTWQFLGQGSGAVDVEFVATVVGPIGATSGTLTAIATPVYGWQGAYNVEDASVGAFQQTDSSYRVSREAELHSSGNAQVDAIRRAVLEQIDPATEDEVTSCSVFQNTSDSTSTGTSPPNIPSGMPPHSVLIVADYLPEANPALDALIAQAIWDSVGAGIATSWGPAGAGNGTPKKGTPTDSQGNVQTVYWVRPTAVTVAITATVFYDNTTDVFPRTDAHALFAGGVLQNGNDTPGVLPTYFSGFPAGKNVWLSALTAAFFSGSPDNAGSPPVAGVLDVTISVPSANVVMSALQRAALGANPTLAFMGEAP